MDDLIHSCSTPQEAVNHMTALDQVIAKGRFQIKEWYFFSSREQNWMSAK